MGGSGDIAPLVSAAAAGLPISTIEQGLVGAFAGLIAVVVVAVMFITAEYRRGMIRTTLAASPRRGRVLAAKAIVAGAVTFVAGLGDQGRAEHGEGNGDSGVRQGRRCGTPSIWRVSTTWLRTKAEKKPYSLLFEALKETKYYAVAKIAMHNRSTSLLFGRE